MEQPILTCPYCKEQRRIGYNRKTDSYQCWSCGKSAKRASYVPDYSRDKYARTWGKPRLQEEEGD